MAVRWLLWSCFALTAANALADWPQFRHDASRTGRTDEVTTPPLELRWRFTDVADPDPRNVYADDQEKYLRPSAAVGQASFAEGGLGTQRLLATPQAVILARGWAPTTCLEAQSGDVRWSVEPAWTLVSSGEGLAFFKRVIESRSAQARPNVVGAVVLDTGSWAWAKDRDGPVGFSVDRQSPLGPEGGVLAVGACEEHRIPWQVGTSSSWRTDYEPLVCFLSTQSGALIGKWSQRVPGVDAIFLEFDVPLPSIQAALLGDRVLLAQGALDWRTHDPLCGVWMLRGDGVGTVTPPQTAAARWAGLTWSVASREVGLALAYEVRSEPNALTARLLETGDVVWTRPLLNGYNGTFPAVIDPSGVYLGLADGNVYCLDWRTGQTRWQTEVGPPCAVHLRPQWRCSCCPICSLAGDVLWVVYQGQLLALDARTGDVRWKTDQTEAAWYEPVISGGWVYLLTCRGVEAWGPPLTKETDDRTEGPKP